MIRKGKLVRSAGFRKSLLQSIGRFQKRPRSLMPADANSLVSGASEFSCSMQWAHPLPDKKTRSTGVPLKSARATGR